MTRGLVVAAASSHSGKTTVSLGLIAALRARGLTVAAAKCGPDYLDPRFLEAASGRSAINLDPWAMGERVRDRFARHAAGADIAIVEGVMGLYDGGTGGIGSTASLAALLGLPVLLVVGANGLAQSAAAIAEGFARLAEGFAVAGCIVNQVASDRHADLIREGFARASVPLLGIVRRDPAIALPSRHLGLVQAEEHADLEAKIARAATLVEQGCDLPALLALALPSPLEGEGQGGGTDTATAPGRFPSPQPSPSEGEGVPLSRPIPRMPHPHVAPEHRANARRLRGDQTPAEQILWQELRGHRLGGLGFRRQVPIGTYVVDFVCQSARLVVEADGEAHRERVLQDGERDAWFATKGYRVLRVTYEEVLTRPETVLDRIREAATATAQTIPSPLEGEGKGRGKDTRGRSAFFPPPRPSPARGEGGLVPLGQRIAVARDLAFAFSYPHLLQDWRDAGAELTVFSPLADEAPDLLADAIFLPGGYPELHAGRLASAQGFRAGLAQAARRGALIYGECGGYMVLGDELTDADGQPHHMLGLLPLRTSFATRKLHLGYRRLIPIGGLPWPAPLAAHEFHVATIVAEGAAERLFEATSSDGAPLGTIGLRRNRIMGSFAHVIDTLSLPT